MKEDTRMVTLRCMVCGKEFEGEEPKRCCSGIDCGCMGMPIDPVTCSKKCEDKIMDPNNIPAWSKEWM